MIHRHTVARALSALLVLLVLVAPMGAYAAPDSGTPASGAIPRAVPGVFIVKTRSAETTPSLGRMLGIPAATLTRGADRTAQVRTPEGMTDAAFLGTLRANPEVEYASPVFLRTPHAYAVPPNDPDYANSAMRAYLTGVYPYARSWWLRDKGAQAATMWTNAADATYGAKVPASSFPVAVIDTGLYLTHPDLGANIIGKRDEFESYSTATGLVTDGDVTPADPALPGNDDGLASHGTFVAGQISAGTNNGIGSAGVTYETPVWFYKVMGVTYSATYPGGYVEVNDIAVINAIRHATDDGAKVINISLGGPDYSEALQDAIDYAYDRGVLVVASTGNAANKGAALNNVQYPAANNHVVGVGAYGLNLTGARAVASFTDYGVGADPKAAGANNGSIDIITPGVSVWGMVQPGWDADGAASRAVAGWDFWDGTSMASPTFAGMAAFLWRFAPALSADQIALAFTSTATFTGDAAYGPGYANVLDAYAKLRTMTPANVRPVPPSGLTATATSHATIALAWKAGTDANGIAKHTVYRGDGTKIADVVSGTSYTVTGLSPSTGYTFYVTATDTTGLESGPSTSASATTPADTTPPSAPTGLVAVPTTPRSVRLTWNASTDASGVARYTIYTATGVRVADVTSGTSYTLSGLEPETSYSYYVKAFDIYGNPSAASTTASTTTPPLPDATPPPAPTGVVAVAAGVDAITLTWSPVTDASGITRYTVFGAGDAVVGSVTSGTTFTVTGLTPGTYYTFYLTAHDGAGLTSSASAPVGAFTLSPVVPMPVYRFYNTRNGTHFFTPSAEERDTVMARWPNIFSYEGVAYSVNPATNEQSLYRFYNRVSGSHFYTASAAERDTVIARWPAVFTYEGETYRVSAAPAPGKITVYRFYNLTNGSHFFTASAAERDIVMARWPTIYSYEGPVFYLGQ